MVLTVSSAAKMLDVMLRCAAHVDLNRLSRLGVPQLSTGAWAT
jgi:hypothetical protein